jgi:hypothetical protein
VNATSVDLAGAAFPASSFNTQNFANIPTNLATAFDAYKRKSWNADLSYFASFAGTHTIKGGYFYQDQSNEVLRNYNGGAVNLTWGQAYAPVTNNTVCDSIKAQNLSLYGKSDCQGRYGYFTVGTGVTNQGRDTQTAHSAVYPG